MKFKKTRADEIRDQMNMMERGNDSLFSDRAALAEYNALQAELDALPRQPFDLKRSGLQAMQKAVQTEIDAIRFLRENGANAQNRINELCRVWPHYRDARRAVIAA